MIGSEHVKTPNIDKLACEGIRFTNWYSNSPVCSPSRASLLTGKYPIRTGVDHILTGKRGHAGLSNQHETLPSKLKENGYKTAMFGKWHLGTTPETRPNAHGFDEFFGFHAGCVDYYSHIFYWESPPVHDLWENEEEVWENGEYLTESITERAVNFIQDQNMDQPSIFQFFWANRPPLFDRSIDFSILSGELNAPIRPFNRFFNSFGRIERSYSTVQSTFQFFRAN
ncbi:sulfatase-like hydrolase/transferase [Bacillus niameyensis]|uniref:sulfatase-like hydrolase/transferase n=1 Tax=Bacillus niameyensis TaxID=1522308 RepID=UPI000A060ACB|nr:sulfatase-like hydrolase/transferase [Bacillus niameyensis]